MVRAVSAVILAFIVGWGLHGAVTPAHPRTVHISGDGAGAVRSAVQRPLAAGPADAGLEVVLLRRWQNLEALADMRRLCRAACDGTAPVIRLRRPSLTGETDILIIDVSFFGAGPALDAGEPLPEEVVGCLVIQIDQVWSNRAQVNKCDLPEIREVWRPRLWGPNAPRF